MSTRESRRKMPCSKCWLRHPLLLRDATPASNWRFRFFIGCILCKQRTELYKYPIHAIRAWNKQQQGAKSP